MHPQYWSRVVRVSSTNPIPYASDAMVGRCRSTMRRLDNLKRYTYGLVILCVFFSPLDCCLCSPGLYIKGQDWIWFFVVIIFLHFWTCYAHEFNLNAFRHEWSYIQYSRRAIDYYIYFIDENKRYRRKFW
jgi:hypothetical protein